MISEVIARTVDRFRGRRPPIGDRPVVRRRASAAVTVDIERPARPVRPARSGSGTGEVTWYAESASRASATTCTGRLHRRRPGRTGLRPAGGRPGLPGAGGRRGRRGVAAHQAWRNGQVLLLEYDGPADAGRARAPRSPPTGCWTALARLAKAVGAATGRASSPRFASASLAHATTRLRAAVAPARSRFLTNPTSGKGRGERGPRRSRCRGCATPASRSRDLVGRDADEALDLARQARRRRRRRAGRRAAATAWSTSAVQALAEHRHPARHHPGRHRQRRRPLLRPPAQGPRGGGRPGDRPAGSATIDLARCGSTYFVTVLAAGFDAIVNERANAMTLAARADALQPGHARRAAHLPAARTTSSTSTARPAQRRRRCSSRSATGRRFGGGLRITEGAAARRRPARRGDHQADVASPTWSGPIRSCSTAPTPATRSTSTTGSVRSRSPRPGIVAYADGERFGALPADRRVRPRR